MNSPDHYAVINSTKQNCKQKPIKITKTQTYYWLTIANQPTILKQPLLTIIASTSQWYVLMLIDRFLICVKTIMVSNINIMMCINQLISTSHSVNQSL